MKRALLELFAILFILCPAVALAATIIWHAFGGASALAHAALIVVIAGPFVTFAVYEVAERARNRTR